MIERDEPGTEESDETSTPTEGEAESAEDQAGGETPETSDDVVEVHEPSIEAPPSEVDRLRAQLEEASARLRTVSKAYTDLQKEMDAFRKRQQILAEAKAEKKAAQVVERFFEPVQNLKRALEQQDGDLEAFRGGVKLVLGQFTRQMEQLGLREVPGVGSTFDPKVHDALAVMPVTDPAQDGKVVNVHSGGWMVGDKVIQPAQVVIGQYQEPAEA